MYSNSLWLREQLIVQCNKQRFSIESNLWCFRFLHFLFLPLGFFFLLILLLFRLADLCWAVCWFVLFFLHLFHYWRWVGSSTNSCNLLWSHSSRNYWEQTILRVNVSQRNLFLLKTCEDYLQNNSFPWWLVHRCKIKRNICMKYLVNKNNLLK